MRKGPGSNGDQTDSPKSEVAVAAAMDVCKQRGLQLTTTRRTLLEILWGRPQHPLGAYPLMRQLEAVSGRRVTATSVYRALDFLLRQGLVMRVESRNGYLPCPEPGTPFGGVIFLCVVCGSATGANEATVERLLLKRARAYGFMVRTRTLEVQGICGRCLRFR